MREQYNYVSAPSNTFFVRLQDEYDDPSYVIEPVWAFQICTFWGSVDDGDPGCQTQIIGGRFNYDGYEEKVPTDNVKFVGTKEDCEQFIQENPALQFKKEKKK